MAWSIIGGSLVSTVLTLFVVPAMYSVVAREKKATEEDDVSVLAKHA
jgi:Cu/Ag efflux pump CusA